MLRRTIVALTLELISLALVALDADVVAVSTPPSVGEMHPEWASPVPDDVYVDVSAPFILPFVPPHPKSLLVVVWEVWVSGRQKLKLVFLTSTPPTRVTFCTTPTRHLDHIRCLFASGRVLWLDTCVAPVVLIPRVRMCPDKPMVGPHLSVWL